MQPICHVITVSAQPTDLSCGQTCLSMLMSCAGVTISPQEVMNDIPLLLNDSGEEWGTFGVDLAHWCMKKGYSATTYTFDSQLIHLPWEHLSPAEIINALHTLKDTYVFDGLGKNLTRSFIESYIRYLSNGGILIIRPFITVSLLHELLERGPFAALVTYNVLYGTGGGKANTHFVVVYGCTEEGNFLIADPWKDNGRKILEPERLISAIMSGQMTCENAVFQISR